MTDTPPRDTHSRFVPRPFYRVWHTVRQPVGWMIIGGILTWLAVR